MDYGASMNDDQNPAGASPWGNSPQSSPRHNRTNFGQVGGAPSLPSFPSQGSSNGLGGEHDEGGFGGEQGEYRRPDTASSAAESSQAEETEQRQPAQQRPAQNDLPPPSPADQAHAQRAQEQPPARRQPVFKLQAKITGLERTGRKDPILRFDVHVRQQSRAQTETGLTSWLTCLYRPTSPASGQRSTATSAASTPNLSSSPSTSYPPTRRCSSPPCRRH